MKRPLLLLSLGLLLCGARAAKKSSPPSLYKRLGGLNAIAAVVDNFVDRLYADKVIAANPVVKADFERSGKAGLKYHLTSMICKAAGGPCKYTGRSMKESHEGMGISEAEWGAAVADLKAALADFDVPEKEQAELLGVVGGTKPDIVIPR